MAGVRAVGSVGVRWPPGQHNPSTQGARPVTTTLTIKAADFAALVKHVLPTAARASSAVPVLRAVRFVITARRLTAYSTDRYVIAAASYRVTECSLDDGEELEFYLTAETLKLAPKGKAGVVDIDVTDDAVRINEVTVLRANFNSRDWPVAVCGILGDALVHEGAPVSAVGFNPKYLSSIAPVGQVELVFHGEKKAIGVFVDENRVGAIMPIRPKCPPVAPGWVG